MRIYQQNKIILTVNMLPLEDNQIDPILTMESLDLDFSKKKKRKNTVQPSPSDRKNSVSAHPVEPLRSDRSMLMEKKKNYSEAIRQRNLNLLVKKRNQSLCIQKTNKPDSAHQAKMLFEIKENLNTCPIKQNINTKGSRRNNQKSISKRLVQKKSMVSLSVLDFQPIPFNMEETMTENQTMNFESNALFFNQATSPKLMVDSPPETHKIEKRELKICSQQVSQKVIVLDSDTTVLIRQNATFKRDLASFRKQNSLLRKQLQDAKNHILELEEKAKNLLESTVIQETKVSMPPQDPDVSNSEQIIEKLRSEIAELRSMNSGLELRAYMAEKKVVEEVTQCKKRMAKEIHDWRDRCTKLRAENMKYKSYRDVTISMQISKDQQ